MSKQGKIIGCVAVLVSGLMGSGFAGTFTEYTNILFMDIILSSGNIGMELAGKMKGRQ